MKRQRGSVLHQQLHNAADTDLLVVVKAFEPPGEHVGALDLPRHEAIIPCKA
jgi:hypothetical protein